VNIREDLKYTKADEWIKFEGEIATIGITDYAQDHLSDIVFAEIVVSVGDTLEQGTVIARIESVKTAADVSSPFSGLVLEVNEQINQSPEILNTDPFNQAWLLKVKINSTSELKDLLDAESYQIYRSD
jgi:glycine cleavage system H protein